MGTENEYKVVLLGEGRVGKTSLILRYVHDKFNDRLDRTVNASYLTKTVALGMKRVDLAIWDTAGQEMFHALGPLYYRDSQGAILVYDITDEDSFRKVKNWVKELKKMLGNEVVLVVIGNKSDLESERSVPLHEAESYAKSVGAAHFLTSAKLNRGITEVFLHLCKEMIMKRARDGARRQSTGAGAQRNRLQVETSDDNAEPTRTNKCCSLI
ncbi:ras-related protein Rab-21 [Galendromus occidentalis]|uniref:Ras-related protein Rab-21 n=1 Tax=Galendromus occidentalis TaxID=34638 RepID=A0AAJ6QQ42_9ACAR|nr:ras-related protein Rab-21 [Galendromus occidentalis]